MKTANAKRVCKLMDMVEAAIENIRLDTWTKVDEISLNNEITLDACDEDGNLEVYAITKHSVVCTNGKKVKLMRLGDSDILTLQEIITNEYGIEL